MSELKEHLFCECDECIREYRGPLSNEMRPYYLKSEADKVIAEKDNQILDLIEKVQKERAVKVDYKISANDLRTGLEKAYKEIRMLRRALWLERARRASAWQIHFALSHNHSIKREFTINGASSPHDRMVTMRTARDWAMIWKNVERKCRAKAKEYK